MEGHNRNKQSVSRREEVKGPEERIPRPAGVTADRIQVTNLVEGSSEGWGVGAGARQSWQGGQGPLVAFERVRRLTEPRQGRDAGWDIDRLEPEGSCRTGPHCQRLVTTTARLPPGGPGRVSHGRRGSVISGSCKDSSRGDLHADVGGNTPLSQVYFDRPDAVLLYEAVLANVCRVFPGLIQAVAAGPVLVRLRSLASRASLPPAQPDQFWSGCGLWPPVPRFRLRPLPHGDTGTLRKKKRRVCESGSAPLTDGEDAQVGSDEQFLTCYRRSPSANMPAIKKERLDGDDMALTAFSQSEYLAPLNATAISVVTPHPPPYDHIFAHHRAYLGLHDSALHHQHLHHHTDDLMLERFSSIPDFQPFFDNGEPCIEVECGENKALLYINKLCQGSKGPSIKYRGEWLTPNEFQFVSGRETAKDWKRSIRHKGKSLKTLMSKGILQVHPPICDCPGCRISSPVNRGRLAEKRTIPLPPNRVPKKELSSIFSSDDSEGSERASGDHAHIKQEEELPYSIMRKSRDSDLSTIISNLHNSRQHGMPEGQSASDQGTRTGHTGRTSRCETNAAVIRLPLP
ncbi:unnamed protein product [Tetraodon nigroviridis]|uniref:(spotted green pufferfish) hypothetical protein n=1 Tax=Tetraodon nigroviridis TaxID=99883 RepID=Q4RVQ8_TETNG|nr:unnamed protein product [Tetraodon nigroviridis]